MKPFFIEKYIFFEGKYYIFNFFSINKQNKLNIMKKELNKEISITHYEYLQNK